MRRCRPSSADAAWLAAALRPLLAAGILLAVGHSAALAAPTSGSCPSPSPADAQLLAAGTANTAAANPALKVLADRWLSYLPACQHEIDYLLLLGRVLNQMGRHVEAGEHLERALLLAPQEARVSREFAVALLGQGQAITARGLLEFVIQDASAPTAERQQAQRQLAELAALSQRDAPSPTSPERATAGATARASSGLTAGANPPSPPTTQWRPRVGGTFFSGYDTNLLGATAERSLTLTLPGLPGGDPVIASVPLDPNFSPKAGGYAQSQVQAQLRRLPGVDPQAAHWDLQAVVRRRQVPSLEAAGFEQAELSVDHAAPLAAFAAWPGEAGRKDDQTGPTGRLGYYVSAGSGFIDSRSGVRVRTGSMSAGGRMQWPSAGLEDRMAQAGCELRAGAERQWRQYLSNPILDGRYHGIQAFLGCGRGRVFHQYSLRAGVDFAVQPDRPGGNQNTLGARASLRWAGWSMDGDVSHSKDTNGYSPLIGQGLQREQLRWTLRAEYGRQWRPNGTPLEWFGGVDVYRQQSNITLFKNSNLTAFLGLRWIK